MRLSATEEFSQRPRNDGDKDPLINILELGDETQLVNRRIDSGQCASPQMYESLELDKNDLNPED